MALLEPIDLYAPVADVLHETMKAKFDDREQRLKTGQALMTWLRVEAKKKPVADLEKRLANMEQAVQKMVENMKLEFAEGKVVIKVNGSDEDTLKAFRLGPTWFEPNPDLVERILTGLFDE